MGCVLNKFKPAISRQGSAIEYGVYVSKSELTVQARRDSVTQIIRKGVNRCLTIFEQTKLDVGIFNFLKLIGDESDYIIDNARDVTKNIFIVSDIIPIYTECDCHSFEYITRVREVMGGSVIECINAFHVQMSNNNDEFLDLIADVVKVIINGIRTVKL